MTVGSIKTTFTPAEFADGLLGIELNRPIHGRQGTIATAVLATRIIDKPALARDLNIRVGTTGSAGQTDVMVKKIPAAGGAPVDMLSAPIVVDNTDADGIRSASADWVDVDTQKLEPGDTVLVEVDVASTAGADLDFTLNLDQRLDPPTNKPLLIGGGTP
jgi:hypothetical protein